MGSDYEYDAEELTDTVYEMRKQLSEAFPVKNLTNRQKALLWNTRGLLVRAAEGYGGNRLIRDNMIEFLDQFTEPLTDPIMVQAAEDILFSLTALGITIDERDGGRKAVQTRLPTWGKSR